MKKNIGRRYFFKGCLTAASLVISNPSLLARSANGVNHYSRVKLVDQNDKPITSEQLEHKTCYIFNYPFVSTPCFLINLGEPAVKSRQQLAGTGESYDWQGGVGPDKSVVGFAAICAHKLSYPTRTISFINYRPEQVLTDETNHVQLAKQQVIYCCSERSVYNPLKGAEVISGPAPHPLTTIVLEYDAQDDNYYAVGTQGEELYQQFFERFEFNLSLENQLQDISTVVQGSARVYNSTEYSKQLQSC